RPDQPGGQGTRPRQGAARLARPAPAVAALASAAHRARPRGSDGERRRRGARLSQRAARREPDEKSEAPEHGAPDGPEGNAMSAFDMDELKDILRKMGGIDEADLEGDIADTEFAFLGYDSLALLELCSQVERRYGIQISDEAVLDMPTPAKAIDYINSLLTAK